MQNEISTTDDNQEFNRKSEIQKSLTEFIEKHSDKSISSIEKAIKPLQRLIRKKIRKNQEIVRIQGMYQVNDKALATSLVKRGNMLYPPQKCSKILADKIVRFSKNIQLLDSIFHLTHGQALKSIFDDGLLGRETLIKKHMNYKPAALMQGDIDRGDGNVICFGAGYGSVDPIANGLVELVFDFAKVKFDNTINHCAFFKQTDLGYSERVILEVPTIENKSLVFCHTSFKSRFNKDGYNDMCLEYRQNNDDTDEEDGPEIKIRFTSSVPHYDLISYNIHHIDQILILNFFRYLDNLVDRDGEIANKLIEEIYNDIERMTDKELVAFLKDVGKKSSNTMEFNFFGAYQIDFDSLTTIKKRIEKVKLYSGKHFYSYILEIEDLIAELNTGKYEIFNAAKNSFPEIFKSYRFLDYLIEKVSHPDALQQLFDLRLCCEAPSWNPKKDLLPQFQNIIFESNSVESHLETEKTPKKKRKLE